MPKKVILVCRKCTKKPLGVLIGVVYQLVYQTSQSPKCTKCTKTHQGLCPACKNSVTSVTVPNVAGERQQVESSTAWRPPPRMSGGRRLTGGKAVREAAGLMQIAAGDKIPHRADRMNHGACECDRAARQLPPSKFSE